MFYLLSFLDRTNLGNARVAGLQHDLHLTNHQYSIALTVTYIPYILAELPSNLLLKAVGPNLMLPAMLTLWGVVTTLQGVVTSYGGLLAARFFLGLLEGNKPGWSWIFFLEGLFTFMFGLISFFLLPRSPSYARFLSQQEKDYIVERLRQDGATGNDDKADAFSWKEVGMAFKLPQVWLLALVFFMDGTVLYGLA
ncbi:hypothetical protein H1R20_g5229, partial [Candolleomyces eurysporus]